MGNLKAVVERLQSFPVDDSPKVRDWQSRVSKAAESEAQTLLEKGEIVSAVTLFANAWNLHKDAAGPPDTDFTRSVVKAAQTRFNICVANRQFAEAQSIETAIALLEPDAIQWWIPALLKLPRDAWGDVPRSVLSKLKLNE